MCFTMHHFFFLLNSTLREMLHFPAVIANFLSTYLGKVLAFCLIDLGTTYPKPMVVAPEWGRHVQVLNPKIFIDYFYA
jgi:hypothetical protein